MSSTAFTNSCRSPAASRATARFTSGGAAATTYQAPSRSAWHERPAENLDPKSRARGDRVDDLRRNDRHARPGSDERRQLRRRHRARRRPPAPGALRASRTPEKLPTCPPETGLSTPEKQKAREAVACRACSCFDAMTRLVQLVIIVSVRKNTAVRPPGLAGRQHAQVGQETMNTLLGQTIGRTAGCQVWGEDGQSGFRASGFRARARSSKLRATTAGDLCDANEPRTPNPEP